MNGPITFHVLADNAKSYSICPLIGGSPQRQAKYGKPVVLVRCDRTNVADNDRGMKLASKIEAMLNAMPAAEQRALLPKDGS